MREACDTEILPLTTQMTTSFVLGPEIDST